MDCMDSIKAITSDFFVEEKLLGRGGNGAVYLCWHELEGHRLGRFAVKIVPVGDSEEWLSRRLQEVRTMCRLKHPNIIEYKHAWMEEWSGSPFAPTNTLSIHPDGVCRCRES